jgi:hypothetical protein
MLSHPQQNCENVAVTAASIASETTPCVPVNVTVHSVLDVVQIVGATLIPIAAIYIIAVIARKYPTDTLRWTSRRIGRILGHRAAKRVAMSILAAGLVAFGVGIFVPSNSPTPIAHMASACCLRWDCWAPCSERSCLVWRGLTACRPVG